MSEDVERAVAVLDAVRDVLSNPERWAKGRLAASDDQTSLYTATDPDATCWCLMGAVGRVTNRAHAWLIDKEPAYDALTETLLMRGFATEGFAAEGFAPCELVSVFNDDAETTHAQVLSLIDDTIARLRGAP